jgi:hypothetical protein
MTVKPGHAYYGAAIRNASGLWLYLRIHRKIVTGDVFVLLNTGQVDDDGTRMDLHASYHRDGRYHRKAFGQEDIREQRQPLNTFTRTFPMWGCAVWADMRLTEPCDPTKLDEVWEIPATLLSPDRWVGSSTIDVDLVEPGQTPPLGKGRTLLDRKEYRDRAPWIFVSLYRLDFLL